MAAPGVSAADMLPQLESARKLALADAQVYTQVIPGILPIIGPAAPLEVRRWGADFLAEGFASPSLAANQKQQMVSNVLPTLKGMLENPAEDMAVVKSAIQASASIYSLVFRRVISHPDQVLLWQDMSAIKTNILRRMDTSPAAVRVVCIKFVQKVVQVQTPGVIADPRRPDRNEISIALVPRNHPLLPVPHIEAETSGLLDRLLSVLQEQSGDPIMVGATMNCLAVLIRSRPAVANKILSVVLNYNPFKHATTPMTPKMMVVLKSLERTTRALLRFVLRFMPNHTMEQKIRTYLERLEMSRLSLFSENHAMKRPAEPSDGPDDAKRQRLAQEPRKYPPMPPPPNSYAQLFTLTQDSVLQQFDVKLLPVDMVSNIVGLLLQHVDSQTLDQAVEVVRQRYAHLQKLAQPTPVSNVPMDGPTGIDDEDDYDPEYIGSSDTAAVTMTEKAFEDLAQPMIELGPFVLPKPPPLSATEIAILSDQTVGRVFEVAAAFERQPATTTRQKSGLNRLAASTNDREAWITILSRIASRAPAGLNDFVASQALEDDLALKKELAHAAANESNTEKADLATRIRSTLFHYVLEDWKPRLSLAISWLTEEWYADKLHSNKSAVAQRDDATDHDLLPNYMRTLDRLLTHLLPRFDGSDSKLLIRFLSELPHLNLEIFDQVRQLARDPATIKMCTLSLQYLVMFRPPVRGIVLDTLQMIWEEGDEGVKRDVRKVLDKWRPGFDQKKEEDEGQNSLGTDKDDRNRDGDDIKNEENSANGGGGGDGSGIVVTNGLQTSKAGDGVFTNGTTSSSSTGAKAKTKAKAEVEDAMLSPSDDNARAASVQLGTAQA